MQLLSKTFKLVLSAGKKSQFRLFSRPEQITSMLVLSTGPYRTRINNILALHLPQVHAELATNDFGFCTFP